MAKFVFRMEQLLNIKKQLEDSIKNDLGKAIRDVEKQKEGIRALEINKKIYLKDIKEKMITGISVQKLKEFNAFINSFENKIIYEKKVLNQLEIVADKIRDRLVQAMKEKKILEVLREKKLEEFKFEQLKKEELELGEIAGYKYIERKAGEEDGK